MLRAGLICLLVSSLSSPLTAQIGPAAHHGTESHAAATPYTVDVQLGDSTPDLAGPWKFHTGDDMAWAEPDFDDSGWDAVDLTTPDGGGLTPGWTARGYEHYSGFAWYRLRVNVSGATHSLSLKMPDSADDAYQVFVNGIKIGEFGRFAGRHVTAYVSQPQAFRLPKTVRNGPITIAIRMWMDSATPFNSPDAGGLRGPVTLGFASSIADQVTIDWDDFAHDVGSGFLEILILLMALLMATALFVLDRTEKAYLWLAIVCLVTLLVDANVLAANFTTWIGQTASVILGDVFLTPMRIGLWVLFWGYWFRLGRIAKLQIAVWTLVAVLAIATAMLRPPIYGQVVPISAARFLIPFLLIVKLLMGVLLLVVAYGGFRQQKAEGGLAAAAVLLAGVSNYQHELRLIHIHISTVFLGFRINLGTVSTILSLLIITVMLLRRFVHAQRRKEQWKLEIQQAQHVQEVLIPTTLPQIPGLRIESEYRPAREVGGDFFQILPGSLPGSALIVVGDVTGKGLQAGMLVAMIIGAIRSGIQHTSDPSRMLDLINEQLCEREHSSATCMILHINSDGTVILANAGHLPPYWNGKELEIEGSLPLGIIPEIEFPVVSLKLQPGDSLVLMSDGIAEAQNAQGDLFGFERVSELLSRSVTVAEIARAAQQFGQEDDILVLSIERTLAHETIVHSEPQLTTS